MIYHLGFAELVDALVLSFRGRPGQTRAAIYQHACTELGLAPADCAFVADGAGGELEAASALGLLSVKIRRPGQRAPENHEVRAQARVESLTELLTLPAFHPPAGR